MLPKGTKAARANPRCTITTGSASMVLTYSARASVACVSSIFFTVVSFRGRSSSHLTTRSVRETRHAQSIVLVRGDQHNQIVVVLRAPFLTSLPGQTGRVPRPDPQSLYLLVD